MGDGPASRRRVLIVEDEADQILMVQARLEASGFEVISAMDGEAGLKRVFEDKPDLVLLDLTMPKMGGWEVCRRLREAPETRGLPVVVLTAAGSQDLEKECRKVGADAWLRKPYESMALVEMVRRFLP
ncbi:MAG: response regulator [Candidatus Omnitrophica bacterium]|nr:response regulator [Candidatus Omnitrophota bacterium]